MKNSLMKIMGVVLTLAILAGLLMSAVPVSAAASDEGYGGLPAPLPPPGGTTTYVVANGNLTLFAQAADGLTTFAWDAGNHKLMKSTDGGATWAPTNAGNTLNGAAGTVTALAVSSNYANDSTIVAADNATPPNFYRSTNGGTTFGTMPGTTVPATITGPVYSLAYGLAINGADNTMLIGAQSGLYIWSTQTYTAPQSATFAGTPVLAVAFSPSFSSDYVIFAATAATVAQIDVSGAVGPITQAISGTPTAAVIFPASDFDPAANDVILVAANPGGLQRVDFSAPSVTTLFSSAVSSVDVNSSGTAYVGMATGDVRYASGIFTASNPTFTQATKKPYPNNTVGANAMVLINNAGDIIVAESTTNGGIYTSKDAGVTYNGTGLIAYTTLVYESFDVIDANIWYLLTSSGTHYMLMKTTNGGPAWQVIFNYDAATTGLLGIYPSPLYSTDKTLYVVQTNNRVWKTVNEGATFTVSTAPGPVSPVTSAFAAKDGSTYYIAYSTNQAVYKSGRSAASAPLPGGGDPKQLIVAPNGDIIMGMSNGNVLKSVDDAATFAKAATAAGSTVGTGVVGVALAPDYVSSNVLYAVTNTSTQGVYMLDTANSKWVNMDSHDGASEVVAASNNTVYYNQLNVAGNGFGRTLSPSVPPAPPSSWAYATNPTGGGPLHSMNLIGNQIYAISGTGTLTTFNDLAVAPAATATPANNDANVPSNNIQFTWNAYSTIPYSISYDVQVARDNKFVSKIVDETGVKGTLYVYSAAASQFLPGNTYYYRVRVTGAAGSSPLPSAWSPVVTFTVALNADVQPGINAADRLSPANGATNVSLTPVLTWGAVGGATAYNIKIATDPSFTTVVDSKDGLTSTVYTPAAPLKAGTNYFWEVQPVNGTVPGKFVVSAFTTGTGAAATATVAPPATVTIPPITVPTPVVTVSVPPATVTSVPGTAGTPAWAWVVIVIGAVLVIAVIVLIVRTRRV